MTYLNARNISKYFGRNFVANPMVLCGSCRQKMTITYLNHTCNYITELSKMGKTDMYTLH